MEVAAASDRYLRGSHNFTSVPIYKLKWGRRKHLLCVKESDFINFNFRKPPSSSHHNRGGDDGIDGGEDGGIKATRERLISDLRTEVNQMRAALFSGGKHHSPPPSPPENDDVRPWNLRTRRAICKGPINNGNNVSDRKPNFSPVKNLNLKSPGEGNVDCGEKGSRRKFSITLSKTEISEDFLAMTGGRPARRPRKRPKYLQKQVDAMLPGFWLSEITADMYKVKEQLPEIIKE